MAEQRSGQFETFGTGADDGSVEVEKASALTVLKRQQRHWKSWLVAVALLATAGVLFSIGGWTIDTAAFVVAALLVAAYRLWALQYDIE